MSIDNTLNQIKIAKSIAHENEVLYVRSPIESGRGAHIPLRVGSSRYQALKKEYPDYFKSEPTFTKGAIPGREILTPELDKTLSDKEKRKRFAGSSNAGKYASWNLPPDQFCGSEGGAASTSYPVPDWRHQQNAIQRAHFAPNPSGIINCSIRHQLEDNYIPLDEAEAKWVSYLIHEPEYSHTRVLKYLNQQLKEDKISRDQYQIRLKAFQDLIQIVQNSQHESDLSQARKQYETKIRGQVSEVNRPSSNRGTSRYSSIPKSYSLSSSSSRTKNK